MNGKKYTCARCKKPISYMVESCVHCLRDFHPSCADEKTHRIFDDDNNLIPCPGPFEIHNLRRTGKKEFKRRRTLSSGYEKDEVEENIINNLNSQSSYVQHINSSDSNVITIDNSDKVSTDSIYNNVETIEHRINDQIDHLDTNNVRLLKDHIKNCIKHEMSGLRETIHVVVHHEINNLTATWKLDILNNIKNLLSNGNNNINNNNNNNNNDIISTNNDRQASYSIATKENTYCDSLHSSKKRNKQVVSERLLIKPLNDQQKSETTIKQLQENIDVINLGINVNTIKSHSKGKIIIGFEKSSDKNTMTKEIKSKLGDLYEVKEVRQKMPKVKIIGIEDNILNSTEDYFIQNLIKQNELDKIESNFPLVKIWKKFTTRNDRGSIILEVCPTVHDILLQNGKVKIGWKNYKLYNYLNVLRCFNCWGFHHTANKCLKNVTCRKCAGNHDEKSCANDSIKCINCHNLIQKLKLTDWDDKHYATDRKCGCYEKILKKEQLNICNVNQ